MLDEVFAAAWAVCEDEDEAAEVTRRVLVAGGDATLGARLAAVRVSQYAGMEPGDRDAVVLARALGYRTDRIAGVLDTTPADVRARIARGLRTLLPPRDCVAATSPAHDAHAS